MKASQRKEWPLGADVSVQATVQSTEDTADTDVPSVPTCYCDSHPGRARHISGEGGKAGQERITPSLLLASEFSWPKLGMRQSFRLDKKCHETGLSILTIQRQGWNSKARTWCERMKLLPDLPDLAQLSHKFWPTNWEVVCYLHGPEEEDKTRNRQRFVPGFTDADSQNQSSVPKSICLQRSHSNYPTCYLQQSEC